jgi:uncharacterized cupredoxin-like copper-binding protein
VEVQSKNKGEMTMRTSRKATAWIGLAALIAASALTTAAWPATQATKTITVTAGKPGEFGFKLSTKTFKHGAVIFKVTNSGTIPHDFKLCASAKGGTANTCKGVATKLLSPHQSATLKHTFKTAGKFEYLCTVPGHAAGGMKGVLKVT